MRASARPALTSCLVVLALAALPTAASATSIAGPNGKIAFASGRGGAAGDDTQARIWVADYPGGTPVQVTTIPTGQHRHPNWSPDHTRIAYAVGTAFSGTYAIWIADLRTGSQTEFAPAAPMQDRPTWSPDGTKIAYGSNGDLWVKDVAPGSTAVQLTNTPGITEERPVWSPDGTTLYYNRGAAGNRDIYMKSPVTPAGAEVAVISGATDDWQPALSPDGKRLCFLRGPQDNTADLETANVNGTGIAPFAVHDATLGNLNCVWSPDGTRILYTQGAFSAGELASKDINGGSFGLLTSMNVASHFDGNADWATNFPPTCDAKSASIAVNGFTTVRLSCVDPDAGFGADPPTATPLDSDALSIVTPPAHGSIGSIAGGQVVYTPAKDFQGTDTFTYSGNDGTSDGPPATVTIAVSKGGTGTGTVTGTGTGTGTPDRTPPAISALAVSPARFRLGSALARLARAPVGTTISFRLSEAARVTLSFQRALAGRSSGRSCVKPTRANRTHRRCTRYVAAGSLAALTAKAGASKVRFAGRLSHSHRLALGRYRVLASARDAAGNRSKPRTGPTFTIVAR